MNNFNFSQQREADQEFSYYDSDAEYYENYSNKSLPEEYTAYNDTHEGDEVVYDRYNSVYSTTERPITRKKLYHKIGRLSKGLSLEKSNEYSSFVTSVVFDDSESDRAKKFQDCNSM